MSLEFHDAPPPSAWGKSPETDAIVEELMANPGQWAVVQTFAGRVSGNAYRRWKSRGVEIRERKNPMGGAALWASWPTESDAE